MKTKKCKSCHLEFTPFRPLQSVCSKICESKYKELKSYQKEQLKKPAKGFSVPVDIGKGEKKQQNLSEKDLFESIWGNVPSERRSFVTGHILPNGAIEALAWYFSHVLPKGKAKYPMFKYYKKNVVLMTFTEHHNWEYKKSDFVDHPDWQKVFRLEEELKAEYEEHKKDFEAGKVLYYKT